MRQMNSPEDKKMAIAYNHRAIEEKWRREWEEHPINIEGDKPKYY